MGLFTNLLKVSLRDFFQTRKKWLIVSSVALGFIIGIHFIINHYVIGIVTELVKEFVDERSEGFYEVDFDDVSYVINKGRFIMNDFHFGVHSNVKSNLDYDAVEKRYIYEADIPRLHIDIIEFWSIFIHRKLRVIGVEIDEPSIRVVNLNKSREPKKITFEAGNLYEVLSDHLNELRINDFLIKDGSFNYKTHRGPDYDNFDIKGVTFEVNNFMINEESSNRKDKIFYMDDIFLEVKSQELYLKDSIHKVLFDKFYLSTENNALGFENFSLTRRENPLADKANHDHYEINIPDLHFTGVDFVGAYNDNSLLIDSFNIMRPMISINRRIKKKKNPSRKNNLLNLAMFYHDYLKIDHFLVDGARVDYFDETVDKSNAFSVDNISVYVSRIELDSAESTKHKYGVDFEKIDMMVKDYEVALPDSINTLSFSEFSMSSDPLKMELKDLAFQPSEGFNPNINTELSVNLPLLSITGFDIARAINEDSFIVDEIYLQRPAISLIPPKWKKASSSTNAPKGVDGIYSSIQKFAEVFSLQKLAIADGEFQYGDPKSTPNKFVNLDNVNLSISDFYVDRSSDSIENFLGKTSIQLTSLNNTAHIDKFNVNLQKIAYSTDHGRLELDELKLLTDTSSTTTEFDIKLPHLLATGIDPHRMLKENAINLDTLLFDEVAIQVNLHPGTSEKAEKASSKSKAMPTISIEHLMGNDYHLFFSRDDLPVFVAQDVDFKLTGLIIDQSISENPLNQFDYKRIDLISINNYDFFLTKQNHLIHADQISWAGNRSEFKIDNIFLSPYNKPNNQYRIWVPAITMSGIDLKRMLKESQYNANEIVIERPIINLKLAQGEQKKLTSLDLGFIPLLLRNRFHGVKANSFNLHHARIEMHQQQENDTMYFELKNLDLLVDNFEVDSTTEMDPNRFLFANDVQLRGDYLANFYKNKGEFYGVNHVNISTKTGDIHLNGIYVTTNTMDDFSEKGKVKLTTDDLFINDVNFYELTQNRELKLDEIHLAGGKLHSTPAYDPSSTADLGRGELSDSLIFNNVMKNLEGENPFPTISEWNPNEEKSNIVSDSILISGLSKGLKSVLKNEEKITGKKAKKIHYGTYLLDTSLLKNVEIKRFLVTDTELRIDNKKEIDRGLVAPDIWLLAEGIKYDPVSSEDSSRLFYSDNIVAKVENLNFILPDNLNSIHVDEIAFNSADSTLKAMNFGLIPLVSRYDFGPAKGFQSTWMKLENDSVVLHAVDVMRLLNEGKFSASALDVHRLDISIFRDKRIPFPEWQRKPLPQTNLRAMDFTFAVDTVRLHDGFVNYQEHAEKAYVSGEIFFSDLNASIINITNDSMRILTNPHTRIGANAKVFGAGEIKAEFLFDLVDMENIHSYGVDVEPFDLTEFNRILIPTASVRVNSGKNERIIMSAKANEDYSYGEMKFYYEDLKIALLNRETETPKGIGNVLGSFFANTFIIRSNNPRTLFLRKGDIFFERDKKRAIFNYWTKTFLSGVVSSLGATNNKKKIKKMQDENLKKIQEQKTLEAKL